MVAAEGRRVILDPLCYFLKANRVRPKHWSTCVHRPPITVDPNDVDVTASNRYTFFQNLGTLIDHWVKAPLQYFLVGYLTSDDPLALSEGLNHFFNFAIWCSCTRLRVVVVVAATVLLATPAAFAEEFAYG